MKLTLSGHHLEITPAIRDYVTSKLERVTRHFDEVMVFNVTLSVNKLQQKVEVNVHLPGKDIHMSVSDSDMYAAIDLLADKLDRQLIRYKEKRQATRSAEVLKREQSLVD